MKNPNLVHFFAFGNIVSIEFQDSLEGLTKEQILNETYGIASIRKLYLHCDFVFTDLGVNVKNRSPNNDFINGLKENVDTYQVKYISLKYNSQEEAIEESKERVNKTDAFITLFLNVVQNSRVYSSVNIFEK